MEMGSFPVVPISSPSTSDYKILQSLSGVTESLALPSGLSASWRKYIPSSTRQPGLVTDVTVIPAMNTTAKGPTVLEPASASDDIDVRQESFFQFLDELEAGKYAAKDIDEDEE